MIIVRLMGGHSNQLFQYAAGRQLASKHNTDLLLDLSSFDNMHPSDTPRYYELDCYPLKAKIANMAKITIRTQEKPAGLVERFKHRAGIDKRVWALAQIGTGFNRGVLNAPDNTMLVGWWQSEKFFPDIRPLLLKEFEPRTKLNKANAAHIKQMQASESVWIHIRRGDYVTNKFANKFHGTKDLKYYQSALKTLEKKLPPTARKNIQIFICSNDIPWCKQNLKFSYPVSYIENELGSDDMRVAKHAKHDILANSSFSWWGAWLNENPEKIVIAPRKWFEDEKANSETDIVPDSWIRI